MDLPASESTLAVLLTIVRNVVDSGCVDAVSDRLFDKLCRFSMTPPVWMEDVNTVASVARYSVVKYITCPRLPKGRALKLMSRPDIPAHIVSSALHSCLDRDDLVRLIRLLMESSSNYSDMVIGGFTYLITGCTTLFDSVLDLSIEHCRGLAHAVENGLSAFCSVVSLGEMHLVKSGLGCAVPDLLRLLSEESSTLQRIPSVLNLLCMLLDISGEDCVPLSEKLRIHGVTSLNSKKVFQLLRPHYI